MRLQLLRRTAALCPPLSLNAGILQGQSNAAVPSSTSKRLIVFWFIAITITWIAFCPARGNAHDVAQEMAVAADVFLTSLRDGDRKKVTYPFDDNHRLDWQFIPKKRPGLSFGDLKLHQTLLATALLQTGLSHRGYSTSMQVMALENVLHEMENLNPKRDPTKYHLFIFGEPSTEKTWGWRIEGHHLSISFTIVDGKRIASTPLFLGASPATVKTGDLKGMRALGMQEDLGRKLIKSLSLKQKEAALVAPKAPRDVINGPGVVAKALQPIGLLAGAMTPPQRENLQALIESIVRQVRPEIADADLQEIEQAGFDHVSFAWMGAIGAGKPHYFRIQGPTFILEYDNTQNNANHVHIVWRDFKNDFGQDLLKQHYETQHSKEQPVPVVP